MPSNGYQVNSIPDNKAELICETFIYLNDAFAIVVKFEGIEINRFSTTIAKKKKFNWSFLIDWASKCSILQQQQNIPHVAKKFYDNDILCYF